MKESVIERDGRTCRLRLRVWGPIYVALMGQVALAVNVPDAPVEATPLARLVQARDLLIGRVTELHAFEAARSRVEARYLDGARADVPAARRAWDRQRQGL